MKKAILSVILSVLFCGAQAQVLSDFSFKNVEYGAKATLNIANATVVTGSSPRFGTSLGLWASYRFGFVMGMQVEAAYSTEGYNYPSFETDLLDISYHMHLNYINVPVLAQIYLLDDLTVELGLQAGFCLTSKLRYEYAGIANRVNEVPRTHANAVDVSAAGGMTYRIGERWGANFRYTFGLTYIGVDRLYPGNTSKKTNIQIGVQYKF